MIASLTTPSDRPPGHAVALPAMERVEHGDAIRATRSNEPREAWERALTHTRQRTLKTGQYETLAGRPRILDDDFT
jgi:hypothetical protein